MTTDLSSLLSKPLDDVKRPPALPVGNYLGIIIGYKFDKTKNENATPFVRINFQLSAPGEDVKSQYADFFLDPSFDITKKKLFKDYYITDDALWRLKDMLENIGANTKGRSTGETIPTIVNSPVTLMVGQQPNKDGDEMFNVVNDITKG